MAYKLKHQTIGFSTDPETNEERPGISGQFFIPAYQRGYRWTADEVTKLLDDILKSAGQPYSLQPIVVKRMGTGAPETWELIDGQQRLTTLWLIFNYLQKNGYKRSGAAYSLEYATRSGSRTYLETLDANQPAENIDYFHLREAHRTIGAWIDSAGATDQAKEHRANRIYDYLSTSVRIIWYEVPESEEPIPLFTRLNQGRIPLTDAELIKAVLLTHIAQAKPGREIEVAAQWDGIERDLQRDDIWAFAAPPSRHGSRQDGTRIDLLLDTLAGKPAMGARRYHTFDALQDQAKTGGIAFWGKIVALHAQLLGWFEEPRWYNKIGFLVACGTPIGDIWSWTQDRDGRPAPAKSTFEALLNQRIRAALGTPVNDELDTLHYESRSDSEKLQRVLLLFNIAIGQGRFSFKEYVEQAWSLEHIHAQNAQRLNRAEQWKDWLQAHVQALRAIQPASGGDDAITALLDTIHSALEALRDPHTRQFDQEQFNTLAGKVLLALNDGVVEEADHGLANLALLSHGANAALSNAVFEVKRHKVLEMDKRGDYIPAATRNVFLKYYTPAGKLQPHFWGEDDKAAYLETIKTELNKYLSQPQ